MSEEINNTRHPQPEKKKIRYFARLLEQSQIQPQKKGLQTLKTKFWNICDIFTFIPNPQTYPVTTKKSRCGSIVLITLFLSYFIFNLITFIINNPPKVNSYQLPLSNQNYKLPQMAIGFIYGQQLNITINDPSLFNINLLQITAPINFQDDPVVLPLNECGTLDWLGQTQNYYQNLSCIYPNQFNWSGLLYASPVTYYPRFIISICNISDPNANCSSLDKIQNYTAGGRIFLFIEKTQPHNFAIREKSQQQDQYGKFYFYNYFLTPFIYNRVIITLQPTTYIVYPNYLTSFIKQQKQQLIVINQQFQLSNVSTYNNLNMFGISILLSSQVLVQQVVYQTSIDVISLAGAFWGVLFAIFGFLFLKYNETKFFEVNPQWRQFDKKLDQIEQKIINLNSQNQYIV